MFVKNLDIVQLEKDVVIGKLNVLIIIVNQKNIKKNVNG